MNIINEDQKKNEAQPILPNQLTTKSGNNPMRTLLLIVILILALGFMAYRYFYPMLIAKLNIEDQVKDGLQGIAPSAENKKLEVIINNGKTAFDIGQYERALQLFQEALRTDPNRHDILNNMGMVYRQIGNFNEALKYYNLALEKDAQCSECYNNIGVIHSKLNNVKSATDAFVKAIALKPNYADPYFNYAILLEQQNDLKEARNKFEKYIEFAPPTAGDIRKSVVAHLEEIKGQ